MTPAEAALALAFVVLAVADWRLSATNRRLRRDLAVLTNPSPARYLLARATEIGVCTQTLKDLGFKTRADGAGTYTLLAPDVPAWVEALAKEALGEIAAESRAVNGKVQLPETSWLWIAKAIDKAAQPRVGNM